MKSKEKSKEEIVLIRYYNVLFYLVFKGGIDDFNRQCLVNRINTGGVHSDEANTEMVSLSSDHI